LTKRQRFYIVFSLIDALNLVLTGRNILEEAKAAGPLYLLMIVAIAAVVLVLKVATFLSNNV